MSSSAACAISGSGKRGGARAFRHRPAGRNDPRSVALRRLPRLRHRTGRGVLRQLKRPTAPECASRRLVQQPPVLRRRLFDLRATFSTLRPWKRTLSASHSGPTPRRAKSDFPISGSGVAHRRSGPGYRCWHHGSELWSAAWCCVHRLAILANFRDADTGQRTTASAERRCARFAAGRRTLL